ncbi:MAG: PAS and helix-turn-helix domain-containing protein [Deltaproteobacteria bacterium]|nr:PAS and helix-turn-helix domain-containing protein [Deltaproteobacteria bacterium]
MSAHDPLPPLDHDYDQLMQVIDTLNCGLVGRDVEGHIVIINDCMLAWLGYTREEVLDRHLDDFAPPELQEVTRSEIQAANAGDIRARLTAVQRKDSTTFPVVVIPQRILDREGHCIGSVTVVVDLGAIQTAKRVGPTPGGADIRSSLERIAAELQTISLYADLPASAAGAIEHPELGSLSKREKEVLLPLISGDRVPAIAEQLHISPHTVRNHLKSIYRKLGVESQSELIQRVRALSEESKAVQPTIAG